jgi:hypothetical protein
VGWGGGVKRMSFSGEYRRDDKKWENDTLEDKKER